MAMKYLSMIFMVLFWINGALASVDNEPDINDVQKAALDYARIRPDELSSMKRRARMAAALPQLQVGARKTLQNDVNVAINDNVSVNSTGVNIGPETNTIRQDANNNTAIEVKALWQLNELIYSRDNLDISEEARYQIRERRMILAEVNKLYFERRRLLEGGRSDSRLEEITADLDALTGGWFSNKIKN